MASILASTKAVVGVAPRDRRQRLALVLTGLAGRDIRRSLDTARADLCFGVGCHLPTAGLHAPTSQVVGRNRAAFQPRPIFIPRRCANAIGISVAAFRCGGVWIEAAHGETVSGGRG